MKNILTAVTLFFLYLTPCLAQDTSAGVLSHNGSAAASNRVGTLPSVAQSAYGNNGAALTQGRDSGLMTLTKTGSQAVSQIPDITLNDFMAAVSSAAFASETDIACLPGNASNTVLLYRIRLTCTQTTAGQVTFSILKRSAANSAGTSSTMKQIPKDANYAAAVSVPLVYSAVPTRGALVGAMDIASVGCMAAGTATPNDIYISPSDWIAKPVVLRGTAQEVCISVAAPIDGTGVTVTGGTFNPTFEWMEVTTP